MTSRVLVVDNENMIRDQIRDFLIDWHVDAVGVGNLEEAEREIAKGDVSVIIQDLVLEKGISVDDVYDFIRKHSGPGRPTETIAVTGFLQQADLRRVVDAGAYCFFKKIIDFDELLIAVWAAQQRVERRLARQQGGHA